MLHRSKAARCSTKTIKSCSLKNKMFILKTQFFLKLFHKSSRSNRRSTKTIIKTIELGKMTYGRRNLVLVAITLLIKCLNRFKTMGIVQNRSQGILTFSVIKFYAAILYILSQN